MPSRPIGDAWITQLTPPGVGAIAALGLRGPGAQALLEAFFKPVSASQESVQFGRFGHALADEVVVVRRATHFELHCHGGRAVVAWLVNLLREAGAVEIAWSDWLAQLSSSKLQTWAAQLLPDALTARTAQILLDQQQGALEAALLVVCQVLQRHDLTLAARRLEGLLRHARLGQRLTSPWRIVLLGPTNVGKSSLINALVGFERSLTSPIAGTTRDTLSALSAIDGWPVELVDTAGLREPASALEAAGIERARAAGADADLVLAVADSSTPGTLLHTDAPTLVVINKCDLPPAWEPAGLRVSALTGQGLAELFQAISSTLVPEPPTPGEAVPFTAAIVTALHQATAHVAHGQADEACRILEDLLGQATSPDRTG